jgi:hypothetical protein
MQWDGMEESRNIFKIFMKKPVVSAFFKDWHGYKRVMLKHILRKNEMVMCIWFICYRSGFSGGLVSILKKFLFT